MTQNNHKLHTPIKNLDLFDSFSQAKIKTKDGSGLSHIVYPDGTPCLIANLFMISLTMRSGRSSGGLSRRGRNGGTIGDYAGKIAQLIRFCYSKKIEFRLMNDDLFTEFIDERRREIDPRDPTQKKKDEITVTNTGRVCLDFLNFIGNFYDEKNFVGPNGVINAEQKPYKAGKSENAKQKYYWHHHSFSSGGRKRSRKPVSSENIQKLYDAVYEMDSSRFAQMRRTIQIEALENTGARRSEIHQLKVSDVKTAHAMKEPMLRLVTLKREENAQRYIPVTHMFLNDVLKFIRIYRDRVVKETIGKKNDHDYVFIGEHGKHLSNETLSTEMYEMRTFAKIEEQVCNQMFRHAFCTNLFVLLIERHEIENEDKFRQQLYGDKTFQAEVAQYTGHRNLDSLKPYINMAFRRISGFQKTVSSAEIIRTIQWFDDSQNSLIRKLEHGLLTLDEYKLELEELRKARDTDMVIASDKAERLGIEPAF